MKVKNNNRNLMMLIKPDNKNYRKNLQVKIKSQNINQKT